MKMKQAATASMLAIAMGVSGCVQDGDEYVPQRQAGFRPPSSAVYEEPAYSLDPAPAPLNPLPDPAPLPPPAPLSPPVTNAPAPAPSPAPAPAPPTPPSSPTASAAANTPSSAPNPKPASAPAPKSPMVAKRVPGKANYIYNPYTGAILDVTGLTPGTEVRDPRTGETMLVP